MEDIEGDAGLNEQGTPGTQGQGAPEDKEKLRPPPSKVRKRRTLHDLGKERPEMTIGEYLALKGARKKAINEGRRYAATASMTDTKLTEIESEESELESIDEHGLPKPRSG